MQARLTALGGIVLSASVLGCRSTGGTAPGGPPAGQAAMPSVSTAAGSGSVGAPAPGAAGAAPMPMLALAQTRSTIFANRNSSWRVFLPGVTPATTPELDPTAGGARWTEAGFDDRAWTGRAVRPGLLAALERAARPPPATRPQVVYYRKRFFVPNPAAVRAVVFRIDRADGLTAYLNGAEVARDTRPTGRPPPEDDVDGVGAPRPAPPQQQPPTPPPQQQPPPGERSSRGTVLPSGPPTPLRIQTCVPGPALAAGENVIAVEVRRRNPQHDDLFFEMEVLGNDAVSLARGPYLQVGTPTSAIVRWRTDCPSDGRLAVGPSPRRLERVVDSGRTATDHEVRIEGLEPETTYHYALGIPQGAETRWLAGGDGETFFVTQPARPKPTRVWVLGDSGTKDERVAAVRDAYVAYARDRHTDLWLMLGDNAYDRGTDIEFQEAVFEAFPRQLRRFFLWPAVGNHETAQSHEERRVSASPYFDIFTLPRAGEAGGLPSGTERYYSFDHGEIHFVCLDSMTTSLERQRLSRRYPEGMLTWLANDLAAHTRRWVVAYFHHPPYTKGTHDSDNGSADYESFLLRQAVLPIFEEHGVDLVMSGHSHVYERSFLLDGHYGKSSTFADSMKKDAGSGRTADGTPYVKPATTRSRQGVVYVVAGSSGSTDERRAKLNHPAFYVGLARVGSLVLDVDGDRLDGRFLRDSGFIEDHFTIIKGQPSNALPRVRLQALEAETPLRAPASVRLRAEATDDGRVARVDFFRSPREPLGSDDEPPYEATLRVAGPGSYQVIAEAFDERGAWAASAPVLVTVGRP